MTLKCKIRVSESDRDGNIIGDSIEKDADLIVNNFGYMLQASIFKPPLQTGDANAASMIDVSNTTRPLYGYRTTATAYGDPWYYLNGYVVRVGTDPTAPQRTDYNLIGPVETYGNITRGTYLGNGTVQFTGLILMTAQQTLQEVGLFLYGYDQSSVFRYWLMMRDTFSSVVVNQNKYANILYTITT